MTSRARQGSRLVTAYDTGGLGMRNRIINGDMRIDQRNNGVQITPADGQYSLDRWQTSINGGGFMAVVRSTDAPAGFTHSIGLTVASPDTSLAAGDYYGLNQFVEGFNFADLAWGTAAAQPVALSFWVRSSVTGTYGVSLRNNANDRSYVANYTINAANTWEYKTVVVPGETSGTWVTNNGVGVRLTFSLGSGSNFNAASANTWSNGGFVQTSAQTNWISTAATTFRITGVQLEAGSVATPFERRPYGTELALCQRYYYRMQATGVNAFFGSGYIESATVLNNITQFPTQMRTAPAALEQSGTAGDYRVAFLTSGGTTCSAVPSFAGADLFIARTQFTVASGLTAGQGGAGRSVNASAYLAWSAEL